MMAELETVAPSVIVCVAILVGVIALLRHEMAPKRGASKGGASDQERKPTEP